MCGHAAELSPAVGLDIHPPPNPTALGAGESGKSTLVKQMKIIHGDGFTPEELRSYKPTICDNLVHSMRAVLEAMGPLHINLGDHQVLPSHTVPS